MHCKTCHYSLAGLETGLGGLTELRCPECGNAFDPNDPNSYSTERQITVDRRQRLVGRWGLALALLTLLVLAAVTSRPIVLAFMIPSLVTVAILTWKHRKV